MALNLQPIPGQRVALVDSDQNITRPWFFFLKTQVVDNGLTVLDQRLGAVEAAMNDAAILLSFERARR